MTDSSRQAARRAHVQRVREQRQAQERRRRAAWISTLAVVGLLAAGLLGVGIWYASRPSEVAVPVGAVTDEAGVAVGEGPVEVEIYLDFLCPACQQFDQASRPVLDEYVTDGTVTVVYRPIAILDQRSPDRFSSRAAAATGCAADQGMTDEYVAAMFAQPLTEASGQRTDQDIVATGVAAGLDEAEFSACVADGTYRDWARNTTNLAADRGVQGTPTIFIAGEQLSELSVPALVAAVDAAAAGE